MPRPVDVERIVEDANAALKRLEKPILDAIRAHTSESYRRLKAELMRLYEEASRDAAGAGRTYAEARARVLLQQLEPYLRAFDYGSSASGVPRVMRDAVTLGHQTGVDEALAALSAFGDAGLSAATATVDFQAVEAAVTNSAARLSRYGGEAIQAMRQEVVDGIIRGSGSQKVARAIRATLAGEANTSKAIAGTVRHAGGLMHHAQTIALTEIGQAQAEARDARYADAGIELVQRFVTLDERTCETCAPRHGEVTKRADTLEKLHPRCRDYLMPYRKEWRDAGLVPMEKFAQERKDLLRGLRDRGSGPARGPAPFEKSAGRGRPEAVVRP